MKAKGTASLALLMSGALLLGACTSGQGTTTQKPAADGAGSSAEAKQGDEVTGKALYDQPDDCLHASGVDTTKPGSVSYTAGPQEWSGYNNVTADTYSTSNSVISAQMFSSFIYFGTKGTICRNPEYGTFEVKSEDPLVVEYTISDKAVWSDGTPVTINDYLLDWASQNPQWLAPDFANGKNPKAKPVFNAVSSTFANKVPDGPVGEIGSKKFTITYATPDPDYQLLVGAALPAHIVAKKSGMAPEALAKAILDKNAAEVKKAAEFWNKGWIFSPGQLPADMSEVPSAGPYILKPGGWKAGQSLTLTRNEKFWGTPPATEEMVFRFLEDKSQATALENQEVQVISPQATVDTVAVLEGLRGVKVYKFDTMTWEHLDFNFRKNKPTANEKVREAFAYCVPRQKIVDDLVKPINPKAVVLNSREVFPFQGKEYEEIVKASYNGQYNEPDIVRSKALLKEAGVQTPLKLTIGYQAPNERRQQTVALIQASCKDAGFDIVDGGSSDFFSTVLGAGDWDIAMYAWAGSGQVGSGKNMSGTNKPQNYGKFSNKTVDEAWEKLTSTLDKKVQTEELKVIEKTLWEDLFSIPLYTHPGVVGADAKLKNIRPTATQDQVSWNASQWYVG